MARRIAPRIALVALLVFLGTAPIIVRTLPTVVTPLRPVTASDFHSAPDADVSGLALEAYGTHAADLAQAGNYTGAEKVLGMISRLPPNIENNAKTYLTLMQKLVSILNSTKLGLDQLQEMITDGSIDPAQEKAREIDSLLNDGSRLLGTMSVALDRIENIYGIDLSAEDADLEGFSNTLQASEQRLTELRVLLEQQDLRAATQLDLSVWPTPVRIDGILHVAAQLTWSGNVLPSLVIELWINGNLTSLTLDKKGEVSWDYDVAKSRRPDSLELYALFVPTDRDASLYRPARSANQTVQVEYYPVAITLTTSSSRLHVLENYTLQTKLADASGRPLVEENIEFLTDNRSVGTCITDRAGECGITTSFMPGTPEGRHEVYARFDPKEGAYASDMSEGTGIEIYYLKPRIDLIALGSVTKAGSDIFAISGQTVTLESRVENATVPLADSDMVVALLGGRELARAYLSSDGVYRMTVSLPLDATGDETLTLTSYPEKAWIKSSTTSLVLKIVNSPIIFLSLGAIVFAATVLSGRSLDLRAVFRRPDESEESEGTETEPEKTKAKEEAASASVEFRLDYLKGLDDARTCLKETYWETRRVLVTLLKDTVGQSETHREYEMRISGRLAPDAVKPFSTMTRLFELAEYSQHPLSCIEADMSINIGVLIAETMNVEIKK